jgi:hypothetical protein
MVLRRSASHDGGGREAAGVAQYRVPRGRPYQSTQGL